MEVKCTRFRVFMMLLCPDEWMDAMEYKLGLDDDNKCMRTNWGMTIKNNNLP